MIVTFCLILPFAFLPISKTLFHFCLLPFAFCLLPFSSHAWVEDKLRNPLRDDDEKAEHAEQESNR